METRVVLNLVFLHLQITGDADETQHILAQLEHVKMACDPSNQAYATEDVSKAIDQLSKGSHVFAKSFSKTKLGIDLMAAAGLDVEQRVTDAKCLSDLKALQQPPAIGKLPWEFWLSLNTHVPVTPSRAIKKALAYVQIKASTKFKEDNKFFIEDFRSLQSDAAAHISSELERLLLEQLDTLAERHVLSASQFEFHNPAEQEPQNGSTCCWKKRPCQWGGSLESRAG